MKIWIVTSTTEYPDGDGSFGPSYFRAFNTEAEGNAYIKKQEQSPHRNIFEDFVCLEGEFDATEARKTAFVGQRQ